MKTGKPNRGSQPAIPVELWPDLQALEHGGKTLAEIAAWLLEHQVRVSVPTISRALAKIRVSAPPPVVVLPSLEPANEADELKCLTKAANEEMRGAEWKQRVAGAHLLLAVRKERRARQPGLPIPGEQPTATTSPTTSLAVPQMTLEQEAEAVRAQLGKMN